MHSIWAASATLSPVQDIDPSVIVSWSFATQQFSRRPAYGCGFWLSRACCILLWLFLASKIVASFSPGDCVELAFLVEALELTVLEEKEQRNTEETVETATLVSLEDGFILELQLARI